MLQSRFEERRLVRLKRFPTPCFDHKLKDLILRPIEINYIFTLFTTLGLSISLIKNIFVCCLLSFVADS